MTAESAADLALNSLLARYDTELEEYYGLIASVQDIDEYFDETEEYFTAMFQEEGLPDEISQLFTQYLNELRNTDTQSTLLAADIDGEVTVEAVDDGLGTSAALIEDQIVEFMKYRGPIEIVDNIVARFSNAISEDALEDAQKDEEIIAEKQDYGVVQGELTKALYYTYAAIEAYQTSATDVYNASLILSEKYEGLEEFLGWIYTDYANATEVVVMYYVLGQGFVAQAPLVTIDFTTPSYDKTTVGIATEVVITEDDPDTEEDEEETETQYYFDETLMEELITQIETDTPTVEAYIEAVVSGISSAGLPTTITDDQNEVYYCVEMNKIFESAGLTEAIAAATRIQEAHAKLQALQQMLSNGETDPDSPPADDCASRITVAMSTSGNLNSDSRLTGSTYATAVATYISHASTVQAKASAYNGTSFYGVESFVQSRGTAVTSRLGIVAAAAATQLDDRITYYEQQIEELNRILYGGSITINGTTYEVHPLRTSGETTTESLESIAARYQSTRSDYYTTVSTAGTDFANAETAEMDNPSEEDQDVVEKMAEAVTEEALTELETRVKLMLEDLTAAKEALEAVKYGTYGITELVSGDAIINVVIQNATTDRITLSKSETTTYAQELFSELMSPNTMSYTAAELTDANALKLTDNQPALYAFMEEQFPLGVTAIESVVEEKETENTGYESDADAEETAAASSSGFLGQEIIPENVTTAVNAFDSIEGISSVVTSLVTGDLTTIRDDILITEYIMDMFSYYSRDSEAKYNYLHGQYGESAITISNYEDAYVSGDLDTLWGASEPYEFMADKNLTNHVISAENNHAYSAEVEYILYSTGKSTTSTEENEETGEEETTTTYTGSTGDDVLSTASTSIYTIRMALNTVSAFKFFYSGSDTTSNAISITAGAVQTATAGIVPIPITKVVLILLLAALESSADLNELKNGMPVAFLKMDLDDWYYKAPAGSEFSDLYTSIFAPDSLESPAVFSREPSSSGLFYSDYLYVALLLALQSDAKDDILLRTGEVITANMRLATSDSTYSLSNANMYYSLEASIQVDPLLMTLPIVESITGANAIDSELGYWKYNISTIRGYS